MAIMMKVRRYQLEHKRGFRQVAISILGGPISVNLGLQIRCFSIIEISTVVFEPFSKSRPSFRLFDYRWTGIMFRLFHQQEQLLFSTLSIIKIRRPTDENVVFLYSDNRIATTFNKMLFHYSKRFYSFLLHFLDFQVITDFIRNNSWKAHFLKTNSISRIDLTRKKILIYCEIKRFH